MTDYPIPAAKQAELARFEELVAEAFGAPIGRIDRSDLVGWYGVRFSIGGHAFIVYQATDGSQTLGLDMTCQWKDGHEKCEDKFEMLPNGFHYTGQTSDYLVEAFLRRVVFQMLNEVGVIVI